MGVNVERREAQRGVELAAFPERAGNVETHDERRARRRQVRLRRHRTQAEEEQSRDGSLHRATSPLTRAGKCDAAITSSIDLKGNVKWPRPVNTTKAKLSPAATTWSTGSDMSSNNSRDSLRNHSRSALSAAIGPRQKSPIADACETAAPCSWPNACRPSKPIMAGAPKRPNRNQVMPRTPTQPKKARPIVPNTPSWIPCCASHGVIASTSSR